MKRSIKSLMLLAVLSLGMNSVCVSPAEPTSADVQAFMEAHKQQLLKRVIASLDHEYDHSFLNVFKERYDEYRSYFPQADAEVDKELKHHFKLVMQEKVMQDQKLRSKIEAKIRQMRKGFVQNIKTDAMFAGCGLAALSCLFLGLLSKAFDFQGEQAAYCWAASVWGGLFSIGAFTEGLCGYDDLEREIKCLTDDMLRLRQYDVASLNEAYAYAFPEESILSEQVQASLELSE